MQLATTTASAAAHACLYIFIIIFIYSYHHRLRSSMDRWCMYSCSQQVYCKVDVRRAWHATGQPCADGSCTSRSAFSFPCVVLVVVHGHDGSCMHCIAWFRPNLIVTTYLHHPFVHTYLSATVHHYILFSHFHLGPSTLKLY